MKQKGNIIFNCVSVMKVSLYRKC